MNNCNADNSKIGWFTVLLLLLIVDLSCQNLQGSNYCKEREPFTKFLDPPRQDLVSSDNFPQVIVAIGTAASSVSPYVISPSDSLEY